MMMVVLVMITAVLDAANNMRIHRRLRKETIEHAKEELTREIRQRRGELPLTTVRGNGQTPPRPSTSNGESRV